MTTREAGAPGLGESSPEWMEIAHTCASRHFFCPTVSQYLCCPPFKMNAPTPPPRMFNEQWGRHQSAATGRPPQRTFVRTALRLYVVLSLLPGAPQSPTLAHNRLCNVQFRDEPVGQPAR